LRKFFNATFARAFTDEAMNFRDPDSSGYDGLPLFARLADLAHTFFFERFVELKSAQSE
jgi:hypothetical protein